MKDDLAPSSATAQSPRRRHRAVTAALTITTLLYVWSLLRGPFDKSIWNPGNPIGDIEDGTVSASPWSAIRASKDLRFTPCYSGFQCAKLELPLDYWNGTYPNETISLAVAKLPARVSVTDPRYGGPVLINPGGPGGSGISFLLGAGESIQTVIDSGEDPNSEASEGSTAKFFDILSFDPRGVGLTEPPAECFQAGSSMWSWTIRELEEGILGSSDAALGRLWSMNQAYGSSCTHGLEGPDIKQYLTTASVARDMLELVERHEEWKVKILREHNKIISKGCSSRQSPPAYEPGNANLQYWGFSYGTYLGSTFASMFPERVGRLILDGVVDGPDYYKANWQHNLNDTEKVLDAFYTTCTSLGSTKCELASPGATPNDVRERLQAIVNHLYHNPLPVTLSSGPEVITYSDVKLLIFGILYTPYLGFPVLSTLLRSIEQRDGHELAIGLHAVRSYSCSGNGTTPVRLTNPAQFAILCADGDDQTDMTSEDFDKYWQFLSEMSPSSGAIWARIRLKCTAWDVRPLHRFRGPFEAKTANPILWIGNLADPVTPVGNAVKMAKGFPGSVVLRQASAGHCSISAASICTALYVRDYFQQGALPPEGTLCRITPQADVTALWEITKEVNRKKFYEQNVLLEEAQRKLQRKLTVKTDWGLLRNLYGEADGGLIERMGWDGLVGKNVDGELDWWDVKGEGIVYGYQDSKSEE